MRKCGISIFSDVESVFRDIEVERPSGGGFRLSASEVERAGGPGKRLGPEGAVGGRIRRE